MAFIKRRTFFRGLGLGAGAHLLGSMVRHVMPEALGQTSTRKRLIVFIGSDGLEEAYLPTGATGLTMGPAFAPLEPWKEKMLIVRNLFNPLYSHLHGNAWALTSEGVAGGFKAGVEPTGISFDRLMGKTLSANQPFQSVALALHKTDGPVPTPCADGPGKPFPSDLDPVIAYGRIFGAGITANGSGEPGPSPREVLARRKSLFDFLRGDIQRLNVRLAAPERAKLEQYLDSIRTMESQLETVAASPLQSCSHSPPPAVKQTNDRAVGPLMDANWTIATNALACGLTSVATVSIGEMASYQNLGMPERTGLHQMWHTGGTDEHTPYYRYHNSQVARACDALAKIPSGNGTMADDTVTIMLNSAGAQHHNGQEKHFLVIVGGGVKGNRNLALPPKTRFTGDAFASVAKLLGVNLEKFGHRDHAKGPIPEVA